MASQDKQEALEDLGVQQIRESGLRLLEHVRRSGIRFLPRPNADEVAAWQARFPAQDETVSSAKMQTVATTSNPANAQPSSTKPAPSHATSRLASVPPVLAASETYPGQSLPLVERRDQLESLSHEVAGCTTCSELASCRTNTVFGEGNPQARFVFFGEGPGADEDRTGRPFVGRAGQLLTKMIEACMLSREEVYILNTVKCRPPGNRNPEQEEIENCRRFFESQLACIRPEYIICLGAVSSRALLRSKLSIGRLRQRFHSYHDSKVLVIYHPAYLLRNPDAKKAAWADLQLLMKDAGLK